MRFPPLRLRPGFNPGYPLGQQPASPPCRPRPDHLARKVFDEMPERTVTSFNSLIAAYFQNQQPHQAHQLFTTMPQRNTASYNTVISGLINSNQFSAALSLFASLPDPNVVSWTTILRGYVRERLISEAESFFWKIPEKNVVTWTVMVGGLLGEGRVEDARRLYDEMPEKDVVARTSMVCGYCNAGRTREAREVFDEMPKRNVVSWTAMVSGYAHNGQVDLARKLFEVMPEKNEVSWTAMLTGYAHAGRIEEAAEIFHAMPEKPLIACNAMITGFGMNGMVDEAKEVFHRMLERDEASWSAMIKIYEQNGLQIEALDSFRSMQMARFCPNYPSIISILTVCAGLAILGHGRQVHGVIMKHHFDSDVFIVSALITMYIKCGDLPKAKRLFNMFHSKDVVMWNSMITGYSQHGLGEDALRLFESMISTGMVPDEITFIGVLSACSYTGKVKEGREIFESMSSRFSLEPKTEHYACMVDLLGRAGFVDEAMDLIKEMPVEADAVVWGALLGACRTHKNFEIAKIAVEKLSRLEPGNSGPYILLSHIYASSGRWKDVFELRKIMSSRNISKSPGCSWIDIEMKVHMFTGGDMLAHPDHRIIIDMLERLDGLLKEAGYCPDGSFVLHDVDEEQKSQNLRYHSERQAVAYGILKVPEGLPIRVIKNLRVCGDCHSAIKLIAKITGREIILRDANRFHHFKDGSCSCADYW
ncbi:uncharacterized protein A4U43_C05F2090 [Asparagus officinalis]|uniref:DYW domain-containing protein n=1 Tax=Asparagus officinalis TaxID=4686 RepID=A0A5P1ENP7_ASPOF|nr:pentatricopeptide repeat-containing protein At1g56690, mitochondrial-like isoform X1 [Asparagus officinalis]XP_020267778.1 pentatricopeptide repeat-containing protein At1g56690, mitochondrial-like isoform X1 [Asparagus officinalis]XP_020267779.1 pentatricopeptide repeat-containing protein At1g56690, mitochondrial-like isoform X1 [Asparagus officinalis]ONK67632.1 uncharacterized protein A4U43_C05F2090 [Asparagus officinalis]